jgi:tetratricopeptide (TPR) repeat protein
MQYIEDDIATHAGIPAALAEYQRLKYDTVNFIVPDKQYMCWIGRRVAELGDYDNAILTLQTLVSELSEDVHWKGYDALAEIHLLRGDTAVAIQYCRKSLDLIPQNEAAKKMIMQLGGK